MKHLPVHPLLVHPRTGEPLRAVGFSRRGPIWPIIGGDGSEDDANDDSDDGDDDSKGDSDGKDDKSDADKDWKAEFEAQQRINRNLERRTRKDATTIANLTGKKPDAAKDKPADDAKPDVDQIKAEAKAEAALEVLTGRVEDKIEAKARAFADPEDAVAVLLRTHDIEDFIDGGKPDADAIADALKELGEKKPHLLAQGGKKFEGDADQGARKESKGRPKTLGDAVTQHYSKR